MKRFFLIIIAVLLCLTLPGCAGDRGSSPEGMPEAERIELQYADQFTMDRFPDGCTLVHIEDGTDYLVVPEGAEVPAWASSNDLVVIEQPLDSVYMAASSAMDLMNALDSLDVVTTTSTKENDWSIDEVVALLDSGDMTYIGKYSAPDYEALLECECDLAVESTMIYHSPSIKEAIEGLGIPVLVERSSYEHHPLGRLEWIKLYGVLTGKEEEANAFFQATTEKLALVTDETEQLDDGSRPTVAFFSIGANGYATVRKPGDYICQMIEMAGGRYALDGITVSDENALSTMNVQLESFYQYAVDSDIMIYNSAIQEELFAMDELLDKFGELGSCKAVMNGDVWCTNKSVFQRSSGICDMTEELYLILSGQAEGRELEYFHKLN